MAPSSPSPVGLQLFKGSKPEWKIGKRLGSGACATVHALETLSGTETEYAIKLAPLPVKTTKKQNSEAEINASRLHYENVVYQNQFPDIQGTMIPNLPPGKGPPSTGEVGGE
jgi:hypothetical protein